MHIKNFFKKNLQNDLIGDDGVTERKDILGVIVVIISLIISLLLIFLGVMAIIAANI